MAGSRVIMSLTEGIRSMWEPCTRYSIPPKLDNLSPSVAFQRSVLSSPFLDPKIMH